jgi:hypothetical protein
VKRILGYLLGIGLLSLLLVYFNTKSSEPQLPDDPRAFEALNMVKDHHSRQGGTIEQAVAQLLEDMEKQGKPYHKGVWRVANQAPNTFVVSLLIREKGETGWIERDYAWRVNVKEKWIRVITLPATHLMPLHELPPLPHSQEIS